DLMEEFSTAFYEADGVFVIPIYPAGEDPIPGVSGEGLAEELKKHGHREVFFCPTQDALVERLSHYVRPGDVVLTLGAGDIWKAGKALLENL
ncbi:MAG TPA: UDP-N-acetylmuramate--L-alanine ligase, partial [Nitrospiria bacterium]|nr:UDP-N-acetylmuramate--L-alanine ligase [Nitrospiria bacterium]